MSDADPDSPQSRPKSQRGGVRLGPDGKALQGRKPGIPNRTTIERDTEARLAVERERLLMEAKANEHDRAIKQAGAAGHKLMKELGFDLTRIAAGLAAFYQPYPQWQRDQASKLVNANPNFDEGRFRYYLEMAMQGARDFASYESPKLSAVMVGAAVVNEINITGGLPDDQDGGFVDAEAVPIDGSLKIVSNSADEQAGTTEQTEPAPRVAGGEGQ